MFPVVSREKAEPIEERRSATEYEMMHVASVKGKEREKKKKKETVNHRGSFREDFTSGWLSTFDNENTCIFIVARRSARRC